MMDFTLKTYQLLLLSLQQQGFSFQRFDWFMAKPENRVIVLRHDADLLSANSLQTANLENRMGITGSYYFRAVPQSFDEKIIGQIAALGHEVGYHYENMTTCRGNYEEAIKDFEKNLARFRELVPVLTICMHGSPLSKWDSRLLWNKYDYRHYGITGEPYYDVDFSRVLYLTDTGRRWDGERVSVRDKISPKFEVRSMKYGTSVRRTPLLKKGEESSGNDQHSAYQIAESHPIGGFRGSGKLQSTFDIIRAANEGLLPDKIMITVHPQRWTNNPVLWTKELVLQNIKNIAKRGLVYFRYK